MRLMWTRLLILFLFAVYLSGCDLLSGADSIRYPPIAIPDDQASTAERDAVSEILESITKYTAEFGQQHDFTRLPIIVRSRDNPSENVAGRCHYNYQNQGHFIEVFKDVIPVTASNRDVYYSAELFIVLLHEIGHCYFGRPHEAATIRKRGYEMVFKVPTEYGTGEVVFNEIPATIMIDTWSVGIPRSLERYYVGEVLGLQRANTPEELKKFIDFNLRAREAAVPPIPDSPFPPSEPSPDPQPDPPSQPEDPPQPPTPEPEVPPEEGDDGGDTWPPSSEPERIIHFD